MDQVFEGTPRAEIRIDGRRVTRSEVSNDWASRLQWKISRDGQVVLTAPARAGTSYDLAETTPGNYEIVLEMWKYEGFRVQQHGRFIEISNKVTYTI
jgi:hypothetical protein